MIAGSALVALLALGAPFDWRLPPGFPPPLVPADNPMSPAKVELGRRLFYDTRLSANGTQACASCHRQALAFSDGRSRAVGSTGEVHPRNAMSLTNVAYSAALTWANPRLKHLEDQALVPMLGERPVELGLDRRGKELLRRLEHDPWYRAAFRNAFPGEPAVVTLDQVTRALACFERTLVSGSSAYDHLVYRGETDALSESAWRGMRLFFSDRLTCAGCHGGINFSGPIVFEGAGKTKAAFHDEIRVPTLRNVALTAPYLHDGSLASLEQVVDRYDLQLSAEEKRDLVEFLRSLTDDSFVTDPRFADPWKSAH